MTRWRMGLDRPWGRFTPFAFSAWYWASSFSCAGYA